MMHRGYYQFRFLLIVEPSADGFTRVISALEGTYLQFKSTDNGNESDANDSRGNEYGGQMFFPFCMLHELTKAYNPQLRFIQWGPLIGIGLEAWADPILVARFTHRYFCFNLRAHCTAFMAETWSDRWEDRAKAGAFVAAIAYRKGAAVALVGLKTQELNGQSGVVVKELSAATGRIGVKLASRRVVAVKPANLSRT